MLCMGNFAKTRFNLRNFRTAGKIVASQNVYYSFYILFINTLMTIIQFFITHRCAAVNC